ncbi:MAG: hypothetical protein SVK54_07170, partial [candidate division WOR-3 bacterium]|nr:hypothetical protein [candidate division WOR-3 bacterium]
MKKIIIIIILFVQITLNAEVYELQRVKLTSEDIKYKKTYYTDKFVEYEININAPEANLTSGIDFTASLFKDTVQITVDSIYPDVLMNGRNSIKLFISDSLYSEESADSISAEFILQYYKFTEDDIEFSNYSVLIIDSVCPESLNVEMNEEYIFNVTSGQIFAVPSESTYVKVSKTPFREHSAINVFETGQIYSLESVLERQYVFSLPKMIIYSTASTCISSNVLTIIIASFLSESSSPSYLQSIGLGSFTLFVLSMIFLGSASFYPFYNHYKKDKELTDKYNE